MQPLRTCEERPAAAAGGLESCPVELRSSSHLRGLRAAEDSELLEKSGKIRFTSTVHRKMLGETKPMRFPVWILMTCWSSDRLSLTSEVT